MMAEGLVKKKRIRAGHKALAMRILSQVDELLAAADPASPTDLVRLTQLKLSLQEKLDILKRLDEEILKAPEEDKVEDEIKQAESFKEGIYSATVKIDKRCVTTPPYAVGTPPTGDTACA